MAGKKAATDNQPSLLGANVAAVPTAAQEPVVAETEAAETALATVHDDAAVVSAPAFSGADAFADFGLSPEMEQELDALATDFDRSDLAIGFWNFNLQKEIKNADGTVYTTKRNEFVNMQTDRVTEELDVIFMHRVKTNSWSWYDNAENRTVRACFSPDQITGEMLMDVDSLKKGQRRKCEGCPQSVWREVEDPKSRKKMRVLDCAPVQNFVLVEPNTLEAGMIRFKKSSDRPTREMLNKFFIGKRIVKDARGVTVKRNYPLFSFVLKLTLKMDAGGKFATPEFRLLRPLTRDELPSFIEQAKFLQQYMGKAMKVADKAEEHVVDAETADGGAAADGVADFDASKMPVDPGTAVATESVQDF